MKTFVICGTLIFCSLIGSISNAAVTGKHYAFYDANGVVRQTIQGDLDDSQLSVFMQDYAILFKAVGYVEFQPEDGIRIGTDLDGSPDAATPSAAPTDDLPSNSPDQSTPLPSVPICAP